ncbi:MAG: hypothetical protein COA44_08795 [Arcobacter sp.]|nr:MAG: hypothetical protein COA44_08795 [Arcobacter sp.]
MLNKAYVFIENTSPLRTLLYSFALLIILVIVSNFLHTRHVQELKKLPQTIYNHPLVVSNASLKAKLELSDIQKSLLVLVLAHSKNNIDDLPLHFAKEKQIKKQINSHIQKMKREFTLIRSRILGAEGRALAQKTDKSFTVWKKHIIDKLDLLTVKVHTGMTLKSISEEIVQAQELEELLLKLYKYARNKADQFDEEVNEEFKAAYMKDIFTAILTIILFLLISIFVIKKIKNYVDREEILKNEINSQREQYEYAVNGTTDGLWDWNLLDDTIYFAPPWKKMLGYEDDELESTFDMWINHVHPDDLQMTLDNIEKSKNDQKFVYSFEIRLRHKDGHWIWILTRGQTIFDENIKPIRMTGFHTNISLQKDLEKELLKSKSLLQEALVISKMGYWTLHEKNNTLTWSDEVYHLFGCTKSKMKSSLKLFKSCVHPEDLRETLDTYYTSVKRKTRYEHKHRVIHEDGTILYVLERGNHEYNEKGELVQTMGTVQDISSQILATLDMKKKDAVQLELGNIIENTLNEVYIFDEKTLKFIFVNKAGLNNLGYTLEEIKKIGPVDIKLEFNKESFQRKLLAVGNKEHGLLKFETAHERKDGSVYPVQINLQKSRYLSQDVYLAIVNDISKEKEVLDDLHKQEEIMIAQSRHAAMGEMIGMIAHQWRQPITTIAMSANNMLADIALESISPKEIQEMANMIVNQTQYLSKTIDDFRNFFKPDKEKVSIRLSFVIKETLSIIRDSLKSHEIEVKLNINRELGIKTYERELIQVFINIIKNAKEALVENKICNPYIEVYIYEKDDKVITKICDNAGGIDAKHLPHIFDPYFTTKDEKTGTGLGLYMSKIIIEKHLLGLLRVESDTKGTCFIIELDKESENE